MISILPNKIKDCWKPFIEREDVIQELEFIESKIGNNFFPEPHNVLRFLKDVDLNDLKCVLVGMDPYPSTYSVNGQEYPIATGRSFEMSNIHSFMEPLKPSLYNILKSIYLKETGEKANIKIIRSKIKSGEFNILPPQTLYDNLEKQGVLFLNSTLTVNKNEAGSHVAYWKTFIEKLIVYIITSKQDVKWQLWGNDAQKRIAPLVDEKNVIKACHPRLARFLDFNVFKDIDDIDWTGTK